jgi:hypothetical protein
MEPDQHPHAADLARLRRLAQRMDMAFRLPVIGYRVGWDSILGLVPGVGDALTVLPAAFILREAKRMGVPRGTLVKMMANVGIDFAVGSVPLVGDLFDAGWKANVRNVDLLERHLENQFLKARGDRAVEGELSSHHPTLLGDTAPPRG